MSKNAFFFQSFMPLPFHSTIKSRHCFQILGGNNEFLERVIDPALLLFFLANWLRRLWMLEVRMTTEKITFSSSWILIECAPMKKSPLCRGECINGKFIHLPANRHNDRQKFWRRKSEFAGKSPESLLKGMTRSIKDSFSKKMLHVILSKFLFNCLL